jgi:hypothetical protein
MFDLILFCLLHVICVFLEATVPGLYVCSTWCPRTSKMQVSQVVKSKWWSKFKNSYSNLWECRVSKGNLKFSYLARCSSYYLFVRIILSSGKCWTLIWKSFSIVNVQIVFCLYLSDWNDSCPHLPFILDYSPLLLDLNWSRWLDSNLSS